MSIDSNYSLNAFQELQSGLSFFGDPDDGDTDWQTYFPTAFIQAQLDYYWNLGERYLRIGGSDYSSNSNFQLNRIAWYLRICEMAFQKGFHVTFGVVPKNALTPEEWNFFKNNANQWPQAFQTLVNTYSASGSFFIGNENEARFQLGRSQFTSITRVSNVVTFITPFPHGLSTGDRIILFTAATGTGGTIIGINTNSSTNPVTVVDQYTVTFSSTGTDSTASGNYFSYTETTVRNLMKLLATQYKALTGPSITVPLCYSVIGNTEVAPATYSITQWVSQGRGPIDEIHLNIYGETSNFRSKFNNYAAQIKIGYDGFGSSHFKVSEFNVSSDDSGVPNGDPMYRESLMLERRNFIRRQYPLLRYYMFATRMPAKLSEIFPFYSNIIGIERPTFQIMAGNRAKTVEIKP